MILINKVFGSRSERRNKRKWKLQRLAKQAEEQENYLEFLEDIEEDQDFRKNVDIYADENATANGDDQVEDDYPSVALSEMIKDLNINDVEMGGEEDM